jgi:hypothetical protein
MLVDEFSRFPNLYRLSPFPASGTELSDLTRGYHLYHPASSDFKRAGPARPPLAIARLILLGSGQSLNRTDFCHSNFCKAKANLGRASHLRHPYSDV